MERTTRVLQSTTSKRPKSNACQQDHYEPMAVHAQGCWAAEATDGLRSKRSGGKNYQRMCPL